MFVARGGHQHGFGGGAQLVCLGGEGGAQRLELVEVPVHVALFAEARAAAAAEADAATAGFVMQQTMLRIKEPKRSLDFYQRILGMTLVKQLDFPQWGFSLYFMGYLPKVH